MTGLPFKVGDRVSVTFDAEYVGMRNGVFEIRAADVTDEQYDYELPRNATLRKIAEPLKVGDIIPARSTDEPLIGTVLVFADSWQPQAVQRNCDGLWYFAGHDITQAGYEWQHITHSDLTVVYLP